MKSAKGLLDSLMGPSRNLSAKSRTGEDFLADTVCKHFLVGFCPGSVLKKVEHVQPCKKLHSVACREELVKHPQGEKYKKEYEDSLLGKMEGICAEADARGSREKRKCRPQETVTKLPEHLKIKVQVYEESRRERLQEAEAKGREGDFDASQMAMRSAEQALKDINGIKNAHTNHFPGESVCEACGVKFLNGGAEVRGTERLRDGDIWEDDHKASKGHEGFVQLREKLAEMRKARREGEAGEVDRSSARDKEGRRGGSGGGDKRSRSRGGGREKEKDREKDGDREREGRGGGGGRDGRDRGERGERGDRGDRKDRAGGDRDRDRDRDRRGGGGRDKDRDRERRRSRS